MTNKLDTDTMTTIPVDSEGIEASLEYFPVNGKWVKIKENLTLDETWNIPKLMQEMDRTDLRSQIPIFALLIESWEFEGDPTDPASYGKMHTLKEFMPLSELLQTYIAGTVDMSLKNSGSEFFSASVSKRKSRRI